jgi:surface protein
MWVKPFLENSAWVEDKMTVATIKNKLGNGTIVHIVFDKSFSTYTPTSLYRFFENLKKLETITGLEYLNTEKVTDMRYMFNNCSKLTSLDVSNFNTKKVTNMSFMFSYCSTLTTIYVNDKFVIDKVTNGSYMFDNCTNLKGFIEYKKNPSLKDHNYANYKTGYFTKLVGKNGDEKIGATGEPLATDNLVLDDGKDFVAYEPFAAKAASYSRKMKEGTTWATLCLPFEVSLADKNFRAFKLLSADDVTETVELEEIEGSIAAGTPVIIKMKDGATKLDFSVANKEIAKDVQTAETANGNYQLQGLYTQKMFSKDTDNNCYIVKGDKLMNPAKLLGTATESVGSKPFRAYMVDNSSAPAAGARMFSISVGGSTTAIEQLETTADSKAEYYDLQGRRLQDLQKGINIVKRGGKTMKVIIK